MRATLQKASGSSFMGGARYKYQDSPRILGGELWFYSGRIFRENFNWFLLPHELGHYMNYHWYQSNSWDEEIEANQIAIAYWKYKGETERLDKFLSAVELLKEI